MRWFHHRSLNRGGPAVQGRRSLDHATPSAHPETVAKIELRLDLIDAAIFDLDGVVTDTAVHHVAAWAELFDGILASTREVAPFDSERDYLRYVDGKPRADGIVSFLASRGITL